MLSSAWPQVSAATCIATLHVPHEVWLAAFLCESYVAPRQNNLSGGLNRYIFATLDHSKAITVTSRQDVHRAIIDASNAVLRASFARLATVVGDMRQFFTSGLASAEFARWQDVHARLEVWDMLVVLAEFDLSCHVLSTWVHC